jgi:hypothetical protein
MLHRKGGGLLWVIFLRAAGGFATAAFTPHLQTCGRGGPARSKSAINGPEQMQDEHSISTYSMTSSARASNVGRIVMPSAFAVLRLITSSN